MLYPPPCTAALLPSRSVALTLLHLRWFWGLAPPWTHTSGHTSFFVSYTPPATLAALQVAATLPFNAASATIYSLIVYGLAGLKSEAQAVVLNVVVSVLLSLIAVQVINSDALAINYNCRL